MESNEQERVVESFEGVIQPLANFINCFLKLSDSYSAIFYDYSDYSSIEYRVQKHLNNPQNFQTLQHYVKVLKRVTDKAIKEAIPDGIIDDANVLFPVGYEEIIRQEMKEKRENLMAIITGTLNRHKILSVKTKNLNYKGSSQKLSAFEAELKNNNLIEHTVYFREIFKGKAPDKKINWIGSASSFKYFVKKLFDTELFNEEKQIWMIAENTFTINGNTIPYNIRTYKDRDVNDKTKRIINTAISRLID